MKKKELTIEDILDEEEVVLDIKQNSNSVFSAFFTQDIVRKLIDYVSKIPLTNDTKFAYKYPFNACELLSSDNSAIMDILLNEVIASKDNSKLNKEKEANSNNKKYLCNGNANNNKDIISNISSDFNNISDNKKIDKLYIDIIEINKLNQITGVVYDNLEYLFFNLDLDLNINLNNPKTEEAYLVLLGYFSQIFSHLIDSRGETLISYLFTSPNKVLIKLLNLIKFKSISGCIGQLLTYIYDDNIIPMNKYKTVLIKSLLTMLEDKYSCNDTYESICELISSALSDLEIKVFLIREEAFINKMFNLMIQSSSSEFHLRTLMKIIIKCNEIIIDGFSNKVTPEFVKETHDNSQQIIGFGLGIKFNAITPKKNDKENHKILSKNSLQLIIRLMKQGGMMYLKYIVKDSEDKNKDNQSPSKSFIISEEKITYNKPQEALGLTRIVLIKYFRTMIDIFLNAYANNFLSNEIEDVFEFFSETQLFKATISLFFRFQFNNIYQTLFLEIMTIVINDFAPKALVNAYLIKLDLLNLIVSYVINEATFTYKSNRKIFSGCFSAVVKLSKMIYESKNEYVRERLKENKDFCALYNILLCEANKVYDCSSIIETINKQKKNEDNRINKIDTEEKISLMNRFSVYEMFNKEVDLFKLYKKGNEYYKELNAFRKVKLIEESEDGKKGLSQGKEKGKELHDNQINCKSKSDNYYDNIYWSRYPNGQEEK